MNLQRAYKLMLKEASHEMLGISRQLMYYERKRTDTPKESVMRKRLKAAKWKCVQQEQWEK